MTARAVSFDFGQTLAELDTAMLAARLAERGWVAVGDAALAALAARLELGVSDAFAAYSAAIANGAGGHPWKVFMQHLLLGAAIDAAAIGPAVDWLWSEQPAKNLWRRPLPDMVALARELAADGVPIAILSNSEGHLAELVDELDLTALFPIVADSGKLGMEKPDVPIFAWTAERLGTPLSEIVHIGDAWSADIEGALAAGMMAIYYSRGEPKRSDPRLRVARDAREVRAALAGFGVNVRAAPPP